MKYAVNATRAYSLCRSASLSALKCCSSTTDHGSRDLRGRVDRAAIPDSVVVHAIVPKHVERPQCIGEAAALVVGEPKHLGDLALISARIIV